jgi:hypothetical protein
MMSMLIALPLSLQLIACERCFCVVSPLRSQRMFKTSTTLVIILAAFASIFAMVRIVASRWSVTCVYNALTGVAVKEMYPAPFYLQNK